MPKAAIKRCGTVLDEITAALDAIGEDPEAEEIVDDCTELLSDALFLLNGYLEDRTESRCNRTESRCKIYIVK